jgi:hypothetical protein
MNSFFFVVGVGAQRAEQSRVWCYGCFWFSRGCIGVHERGVVFEHVVRCQVVQVHGETASALQRDEHAAQGQEAREGDGEVIHLAQGVHEVQEGDVFAVAGSVVIESEFKGKSGVVVGLRLTGSRDSRAS